MKIEFYLNDKTDLDNLITRLAISITLKPIHTIYINDKEFDLDKVRRKLYRTGVPDIRE